MAVLHRIYAQALLEAAKDADDIEAVRDELTTFVEAAREVPELHELLRNPLLDRQVKAAAVRDVLADADETFRNFVLVLVEKGRAGEVEEIAREFDRLVAAEENVLDVELTTAVELSEDDAREVIEQIERAAGRRVEATRKVDPDLIGGLVLQAGSLRVDSSVRGRLNRLRQDLLTRS